MKLTTLNTDVDLAGARTTSPRARRRALQRLTRAERRFARAEAGVESALAATTAAENAVLVAMDRPDLDEITVLGLTVARHEVTDVLAAAQHDLAVAVRRHFDAAERMTRASASL